VSYVQNKGSLAIVDGTLACVTEGGTLARERRAAGLDDQLPPRFHSPVMLHSACADAGVVLNNKSPARIPVSNRKRFQEFARGESGLDIQRRLANLAERRSSPR
jgi:hypothetical protein